MRSVDDYDILGELGRGNMGIVQLARQRDLNRLVALKELKRVRADAPELAERFVREARLAASLSHSNIVTVFEAFEEDEMPYIAMEYLPRGSLRPWVGNLTFAQLAGVLEGLLAGLGAAESAGIVHRDLKPENVMVGADGRVKIADFGIAKATAGTGTDSMLTTTGATVGTPAYMAPEQALSDEVGPWTDLYSLGIMAYEQLVGQLPFSDSRSSTEILLRHVSEPIAPVIESRPDVNPKLSEWVAQLLLKEPTQRPASATQAWDQLEEIILEVLDPRWRRDALLPKRPDEQRGSPQGEPTPPRAESRILSYQRTPGSSGASSPRLPSIPSEQLGEPSEHVEQIQPAKLEDRSSTSSSPRQLTTQAMLRSRRRLLATLTFGALTLSAGFVVAPTRNGTGATAGVRAATRSYEVLLPSDWRRDATTPPTPGLELDAPIAAISSIPGGRLVMGIDATVHATPLPPGLLSILRGQPREEAVRLEGKEFYRYRNLRPRGVTGTQTIYVQPTTNGRLIGACTYRQSNKNPVEVDCEHTLGSARLLTRSALALGPSPTYALKLSGVMADLNSVRVRAGQSLVHARTPAAQSAAAQHLAAAHMLAAARVRKSGPGPDAQPANTALANALTRLADGYTGIAKAAKSADSGRFAEGRNLLRTGTRELFAAQAQLRSLGYKIGS